jgi:gliding motility-associated-like protein
MNINSTKLLVALFFSSIVSLKAQQSIVYDEHNHEEIDAFNLPLDFDKDSLKGFNENAAWQQAKMGTDQVWRQERFVAVLKRSYIDFKYGLSKAAPMPVVQGPCTNPDFETGNISGWVGSQSPNNNSQTMLPWSNLTTTQATIVTPGNDPNIGAILQRVPPGGGNFACRLGPTGSGNGGNSYRLTQTFTVTAANSAFIYRYAVMLNNSSPHSCTQQPFFNVSFKDCSNNPIPCGQYDVAAVGSGCSTGADPSFVTSGSWAYKQWTTAAFDLTPYIGQCVNLQFTVGGCVTTQGAHGGYAYIDASCQPFTLNLNGDDIPVGQTNNSICGSAVTNTLCAPPGFSYSWTGPGVNGQTGQCVNASSNGTYSVTLGIPGTTCPFSPVLYSTFNSTPNPTLTASLTQPVCVLPAGTATLNVNGGTGPYTYSWTPAAPSNSVNTNLPAGTSYTASVTDDNGCVGSTTFSIDPYPPAPDYTLSVNPGYVLSCSSPSTTITFAPTNTNTSNQWDGPSGAITGTNVVVTAPGTYTYSTINTVSTCSLTGTIVITSDVNLPSATFVTSCNTDTVVLTATPSASTYNVVWTEPTTPPNAIGNPATSTATGVFTLTITDPSNGCIQTYTTETSLPPISIVSSPTSNVLTCITTTVNATATSDPGNTFVWNNGTSTVTTNPLPISANGTYTAIATNSIGCSSQSVITVSTNTAVIVSITPSSNLITCATGSVSLSASSSVGGPYTYSWTPSVTTTTGTPYVVTSAGDYTVVALNSVNGCTATATQVIGSETIDASFIADTYQGQMPLPVTFTNTSVVLNTNPAGTNYTWSFGDGNGIASNDTTVNHLYNSQGNFPVILTATNGFCSDTAVRYIKVDLISVFEVPNVFTPNGDGKNDVFTFNAINMGEITLTIFDRWGLKMFEATDIGNVKWDGKNKGGSTVTDGTYFYIIKATGLDDAKYDLKGSVNVFQ